MNKYILDGKDSGIFVIASPVTALMANPVTLLPHRGPSAVKYLDPVPPVVRSERILRIQGYSDLGRVRRAIVTAAVDMAALASSLSRPKAAYRYVPVRKIEGDELALDGAVALHCAAFGSRLSGCFEVVPLVLSVGDEIGQRVIDLAEAGDLLEAVLLETAGWLCIEDATRQFTTHLREEVSARGSRITSRMGPGYSYRLDDAEVVWPLEQQPTLFGLFGTAELPVTLMSSCAMSPKLSRSGLYGVAPLRLAPSPVRAAPLFN